MEALADSVGLFHLLLCVLSPPRLKKMLTPIPHREVRLQGHSLWLETHLWCWSKLTYFILFSAKVKTNWATVVQLEVHLPAF